MIANSMRNQGEDLPDVKIVEKILRSLTKQFNYIICSIEESKDIDSLSVDELQSSLMVHEHKFRKKDNEEQILKVSADEWSRSSRGRGRNFARGRGRGKGRRYLNKDTVECYKCHKLGHFQYECPVWNKEANYAEMEETEELLLMASEEESKKEEVWFLDSGCSNHMCGERSAFSELDDTFKHVVKLRNNMKMDVSGKGNVRICVNGVAHVITGVYYIPELKNNLLSLGQLQERGLTILIQSGTCKIYHPQKGLIIQTSMTSNRMFALRVQLQARKETCFNTMAQDTVYLWHCRFGHLSYRGLETLYTKDMVIGLPKLPGSSNVCEYCMKGKQHRDSIPKQS